MRVYRAPTMRMHARRSSFRWALQISLRGATVIFSLRTFSGGLNISSGRAAYTLLYAY